MADGPRTPRWDPFRFDRRRLAATTPTGRVAAGADEAGRGCLAGPLVAAAVSLDYARPLGRELRGLTDSKMLSRSVREALYLRLLTCAAAISVVAVSAHTIDRIGLHTANLWALETALRRLGGSYDLAFVDGFRVHDDALGATQLVRGDSKSACVAAASVVAKVTRDRLMVSLDDRYPEYGFAAHVGYGTVVHRAALQKWGPCALHRRCFAGVGTPQMELFSAE